MSRIFREFFCGHFPWKLQDENLQKNSPKFRRIFADLLQEFRENFALGECGHKISCDPRRMSERNYEMHTDMTRVLEHKQDENKR